MKDIIKKIEDLEEAFRDPEDDDSDVDWEELSQEEKDKVIRGARVLIKHRRAQTDLSEEDLAVIRSGIAVLHAHAKPKGSLKKSALH